MLLLPAFALAAETCITFGSAEASVVVEDIPAIESSGVAASRAEDGTWYTHGDRGDAPHLYVFRADGSYLGEQIVRGAENVDWEDLANGPCLEGDGDCLWIADIGDNDQTRASVQIYVVPATLDAAVDPRVCTLVYPDGAEDAEALLVFPDGSLRVVDKHDDGAATVYLLARPRCDGSPEPLVAEAELSLDGAVTGGAVSPDGLTVVLRTYTGAWTWSGCPLRWGDAPTPVDLGGEAQGEAVAFANDGSLLTTSEGEPFRLRSVPCAERGEAPCSGCGGCGGVGAAWLLVGLGLAPRRYR